MKIPLKIAFRNMEHSDAVEDAIKKWVGKLERSSPEIISCWVTVEAPSEHKRHGGFYHTKIDIRLPGGELVINRQPDEHHSYVDAYVSIRDAFKNALRQIEDFGKRRQGQVKTHESAPHGRIKSLAPEGDHGFIETTDGREIYFHKNSILDADFDKLSNGTEVRFVEHDDSDGVRASSVRVVSTHPPL
jgi:cold shock CspA family protein